jgi:hypothetical protein
VFKYIKQNPAEIVKKAAPFGGGLGAILSRITGRGIQGGGNILNRAGAKGLGDRLSNFGQGMNVRGRQYQALQQPGRSLVPYGADLAGLERQMALLGRGGMGLGALGLGGMALSGGGQEQYAPQGPQMAGQPGMSDLDALWYRNAQDYLERQYPYDHGHNH